MNDLTWLEGQPKALGYHTFTLDLSCVDCGCSWPCAEYITTIVRVFDGDAAGIREFMSHLASGLADLIPGMTGEQIKRRLVGRIAYECEEADRAEPMNLVEMAEYLEAVTALEGIAA
ncbi:hypothetical protein K1W54_27265 [Micromonospora sp. CPCC 205371]|nr:hypothetical protein [Micromonospora sp. CPCC 205371]